MERMTVGTSTGRVAWWISATLCLLAILACTLISGGLRRQAWAGEIEPSSAPPPTQGDIPNAFGSCRKTPHVVFLWP